MSMKTVKVYARMFDGLAFWGYVFLKEDQRVQDLLNDERKFIPIRKLEDKRGALSLKADEDNYKDVCIHKDGIYYIEEI